MNRLTGSGCESSSASEPVFSSLRPGMKNKRHGPLTLPESPAATLVPNQGLEGVKAGTTSPGSNVDDASGARLAARRRGGGAQRRQQQARQQKWRKRIHLRRSAAALHMAWPSTRRAAYVPPVLHTLAGLPLRWSTLAGTIWVTQAPHDYGRNMVPTHPRWQKNTNSSD